MAKKKVKPTAKKPVKKQAKKAKPVKKSVKKAAKTAPKKKAAKKAKAPAKKSVKKTAVKAVKPEAKKTVKKAAVKKTSVKPVAKFVAHTTHLKAGDKAPFFEGKDQNGNTVSLNSLAGKTIILYFYPKDDTPGCTAEACSLRDEYKYLSNKNYAVVGVSADDERSHAKFASKYSLPFPLIADTSMAVIKAYNVFGKKQFMGKIYDGIIRTTFVISPEGNIKHVVTDVNTKDHAKQVLAL